MPLRCSTCLAVIAAILITSLAGASVKIVATTGMIGDVARNIGGSNVTVKTLMGEGVDPHLYTPRASDVRSVLGADVILYNGLMLEGRMGEVFKKASERGIIVTPVAEVVEQSYLMPDPEDADHPDPHVWMDVKVWGRVAGEIARVLGEADPDNAAAYTRRAGEYQAKLKTLDGFIRDSIKSVPENQRVLVTAHDAFGYFGRAYGVEVMAIQGISTESEAGLADVNSLVDVLVERKIPAVFVESSVPDKYVRAVIEGAAAKGHEVKIGGELFSDAMGRPGTHEGTYRGMMQHNGETIAKALGGSVPMVVGVNVTESSAP
ncbi:MAG: zinc ABC transporter substrate-binding protein [Phycisphaerales bacterium]|nr:zinc ABC transporter substrate-binding protein [Phycisphaerales bacterium]